MDVANVSVPTDDIATKKTEVITKSSGVHSGNILSSLMKLRTDDIFCDATIVCGDFNIKAHKNILASATDYFKGMFLNETKEAKTGVVDFSNVSPKVVEQCISFVYSGNVEISMTIARDLLDASEMMQLSELSRLCLEFFAERVDIESCTEMIRLSILYNDGFLNESVKTFLKNNFNEFSQSDDFSSLEYDILNIIFDLLEKDSESVELQKWKAIVMWTNANLESRKYRFVELFQMVNLRCISESDIRENIWTNSLVDESLQCMKLVRDAMINRPNSSEVNNTSQMVSFNGVSGLIPEIAVAPFQQSTSIFHLKFNSEMDLIYYHGSLYIGTGLRIYKFIDERWDSYPVDFAEVKRNLKSLTCRSCYKDHWCLGMEENLYRIEAQRQHWNRGTVTLAWTTQTYDSLDSDLEISHHCKNCKNLMEKENFNASCYSRCIGLGDSVYMLTMNYVVEYRISTSKLIHHNVVVGLGNGFGIAASNDRIYALSGNGTERKAVAFDLVTFQIIQLPNMARGCTFGYSLFKDNKLYACSRERGCTKWVHVKTTDSELRDTRQVMKIMHPPAPIHFGRNLLMDMPQAKAMISSCSAK